MASCQHIETGLDVERDLISELPLDLRERILECLSTRDGARTALLSTHWKNAWLCHGRLAFVYNSKSVKNKLIIFSFFVLDLSRNLLCIFLAPRQSDLDRWCLFLSRNGIQKLNISNCNTLYLNLKYKLPFCIFSCQTIKHLELKRCVIDLPVNGDCIFSGVTSLIFEDIVFKNNVKGNVFSIPKLEKLAFQDCDGIENFDISAPKLRTFSQFYSIFSRDVSIPRWFSAHLEAIKYLCLTLGLSETKKLAETAPRFPTARNLQVIKLYYFNFGSVMHLKLAIQLLEKSPNLCRLEIDETRDKWNDDKEVEPRIFQVPDIINEKLGMLNTIKIESFKGSNYEILFLKALFSKFPALNKIVIQELRN